MTKTLIDAALDAAFNYVADRATLMTLCEGGPSTYFQGSAQKSGGGLVLASVSLTPGLSGGDFTVADGTLTGRRLAVAARSTVAVSDSGTADHLALLDDVTGTLLVVTELTETLTLTPGTVVGVKSFSIEILDPV